MDKSKTATSTKPDHLLGGGPRALDTPRALPLQVRLAVKVCACGHLEAEHNLSTDSTRRTACSTTSAASSCDCRTFLHETDRHRVSTYVDLPAGADPLPMRLLTSVETDTALRHAFGAGVLGEACPSWSDL